MIFGCLSLVAIGHLSREIPQYGFLISLASLAGIMLFGIVGVILYELRSINKILNRIDKFL